MDIRTHFNIENTMKMKIKWYDLWVGVYYDRKKRTFYICPFPTIVVIIQRKSKAQSDKDMPSFFVEEGESYVPDRIYNEHFDGATGKEEK